MFINVSKAQEATWYEVDYTNHYEVNGFVPTGSILYYSERDGGNMLKEATADSNGYLTAIEDSNFHPALALDVISNQVRFFDIKEFTFNDLVVTESNGQTLFNWNAAFSGADIYSFNILKSIDSIHYTIIGNVPVIDTSNFLESYSFQDTVFTPDALYKVQIIGMEKGVRYTTEIISMNSSANRAMQLNNSSTSSMQAMLFPTVTNNKVNVLMPEGSVCVKYSVVDLNGKTLISESTNTNCFVISLQMLEAGCYIVQIENEQLKTSVSKVIKL